MKNIILASIIAFTTFLGKAQTLTTQTRNDAGAPTTQSGFYETNNPVNYPTGASDWWHLLDVRHTNSANNYGMQFSGSFYDQNLWFRKTNSNPSQGWSKVVLEDVNGRVGIGGTSSLEKLLIIGNHENSSIQLYADNGSANHAYLTLWASEPSTSWTGVGIGNNVRNYNNSQAFTRINTNNGGSYIRLLENEINFNLISNSGVKQQPFTLFGNGNATLHGKFEAKEIKVTQTPTADFVFAEDYNLPKLEDVENHIKEKKHLPEIASAKEMEQDGVNVGEFQIKLLQKIEELTLYSIEQNKQIKYQSEKIDSQSEKIKTLEQENKQIKSLLERIEKLEHKTLEQNQVQ